MSGFQYTIFRLGELEIESARLKQLNSRLENKVTENRRRAEYFEQLYIHEKQKNKAKAKKTYGGVSLDQLISNIIKHARMPKQYRFIKYKEDQLNAVVQWAGELAVKQSEDHFVIFNVDVLLDA